MQPNNGDVLSTRILRSDLPLKWKSGNWQQATVAEQGITSEGSGISTFTSTISPSGIVTTYETGTVSTGSVSSYTETISVSSKETLDLNTGSYKFHRLTNSLVTFGPPQSCAENRVDNIDDVADLPVALIMNNSASNDTLQFLNPAAANDGPLPLLSNVPVTTVQTAPAAMGLAADGVSAAALVYQSSSADPVTFTLSAMCPSCEIGGIAAYSPDYLVNPAPSSSLQSSPISPINGAQCTASNGSNNPQCVFVALLYAPPSMPNNYSPGTLPIPLTLSVQAVQTSSSGSQDGTVSNSILLMPPPLVLVHGIWSNAEAWYPFQAWIETNYPHQFVSAADYGATSSLSFTNPGTQQVLAMTIANALTSATQGGVVAQKVDIVAHSMGGLVTRYLMDYGAPAPFVGYVPSKSIHRLVTVGTPYFGSALAQVLDQNPTVTPATGKVAVPALCSVALKFGSSCTLSAVLALTGKQVGAGTQSLEPNSTALQSLTDSYDYQAIVGGAPVAASGASYGSATEGNLDLLISSFYPGSTVDSILGSANDTIVSSASVVSHY